MELEKIMLFLLQHNPKILISILDKEEDKKALERIEIILKISEENNVLMLKAWMQILIQIPVSSLHKINKFILS